MPSSKKCLYTQDLLLMLVLSLLSIVFILVSPFNETPLRIVFALLIIFFIPGYAFISALFPGNREISGIERFTLSVGFSIVIMVFDGFIISVTQWKFRPDSITISLSLLTFAFVLLAYLSRSRLPHEEQFSFSYGAFVQSLKEEENDPEGQEGSEEPEQDTLQSNNKKFRAKTRTKISTVKTAPERKLPRSEKNIPDRIPPAVTKALMIAMVLSIILAGAMFVYAKETREKETFTALYILGDGGKAENYPSTLSMTQPTSIIAGIENYEHEDVNYILQVRLDGTVLGQKEISLQHKEKWEQELKIKTAAYKQGRQRLDFLLYKETATGGAYRSVHLWVTQEFGSQVVPEDTVDTVVDTVIDFITMDNPSMDLDSGWEFTTTNETVASGSYVDGGGIYSGRAYVINSSYQGLLPLINRHYISQEFQSDREENVLLSVYLKDTYTKGTAGKDEAQSKQVLLNGAVVWTDGINGNEGWQRLQVPVTLVEGTNTLAFTLMQNRNQLLEPVEMIIDEISFQPASEVSPYLREDYTIEFDLPVSKVLPLAKSISNENFIVSWNGTDIGSGIAYYNIDYSTDGTTWQRWLSGTTETTAQFSGKAATTYYFRSMAVDNAQNREPMHLLPDTSTTIDVARLEVTLDITPNPTSESTNLIVEATRPLSEVTCNLNSQNFGVSDTLKLTTKDGGITWTGKYTLKVKDNFNVEVLGKDYSNNTAYTFGTIYSDTSLEKLVIRAYPEKTSSDFEIGITPSFALQDTPKVTVRDRNGKVLEVDYEELSGNEYIYTVTVDDDIADGVGRITATAKTSNSESLYEEETFIIDRVKPTIQSNTPDSGETVNTDSPTIKASYSDDRAGIERSRVILRVNGIDVTSSAEVGSSSVLYTAAGLDNGQVEVYLSVTDQAGNSREKTWTFVVNSA
ncbi:DUF1616 domain-containing protein [Methanolobus sp.]|uniref:DUF1616 domain-containing protein n=1 Tax=Methanolobus sp. TaxID=1874737 RepID=UPI0025FAFA0B|nr:DUF1616 domain-containing protein [Methanolobus sp.]